MRILSLLILFCFLNLSTRAQKSDRQLQEKIDLLVKGFKGEVGIYVKHLKKNKTAFYNADTIFPTASMIKIPILVGVMDKIEKHELSYTQQLVYRDSLLYAGEDVLGSFKQDEKIQLGKVVMLMLTLSDNTASLWLQSLAGTGLRVNEIMDSLGLKSTRVNSRTPGREQNRTVYGWGQTTPREMALLMEKIFRGEVISKKASEKMIRLLGRNYWDEQALSQIPPGIFATSKNGWVSASRSETVLVMAPHGAYVFSVITKQQTDNSFDQNNEGWKLITNLSALLWNHFEPGSKWKP